MSSEQLAQLTGFWQHLQGVENREDIVTYSAADVPTHAIPLTGNFRTWKVEPGYVVRLTRWTISYPYPQLDRQEYDATLYYVRGSNTLPTYALPATTPNITPQVVCHMVAPGTVCRIDHLLYPGDSLQWRVEGLPYATWGGGVTSSIYGERMKLA